MLHADVDQLTAIEQIASGLLHHQNSTAYRLLGQYIPEYRNQVVQMLMAIAKRNHDREALIGHESQRTRHSLLQQQALHSGHELPIGDADGSVALEE